MIRILGTIFAGLLGLAFGSFLNVCLSRWPHGESIVSPRSHCRNCDHVLAWWENIPLLSWLVLRGRCRTCRTAISWRYPIVEISIAVLWAIETWTALSQMDFSLPAPVIWYQLSVDLGMMFFCWCLVALSVLDAENFWLPNMITLPGIGLGIAMSIVWIAAVVNVNKTYFGELPLEALPLTPSSAFLLRLGSLFRSSSTIASLLLMITGPLTAASLILIIRWLYKLIRHREGLGLGDAKLMALLAAWLGLPGALLAFVLGSILGALVALALLAFPSARTNPHRWATSKLPLGTFLCIGGIVSSLWGQPILAAYLRWAGF